MDADIESFRADLKEMWFGLYARGTDGVLDSSGFQHVFQVSSVARCNSYTRKKQSDNKINKLFLIDLKYYI